MIAAPRGESRYFVLALFTISMMAGSLLYGGIGQLVPSIGLAFKLPHAETGWVATAMILGGLSTIVFSGTLCDRFGDKALMLESGLLMGGSMMAAAAFPNYAWLLICFFLYGIGNAANNPAGTHAILAFFTRDERGMAMGVRQTGMPIGGAVGALLFALVAEHYGYRGAMFAGGAVVAVVCTASALLYRQPKELCGEHVPLTKLLEDIAHIGRDRRLILTTIATMLLICVQTAFIVFFPITMLRSGYSAALAALLFAGGHMCAAVGRLFWGRLSDKGYAGNRTIPMAYCGIVAAFAALLLSAIAHLPFGLLCVAVAVLGFSGEGWFGLALIAMAEIGGEEHAGGALGFGITGMMLGAACAPIVIGLIAGTAGDAAAWQTIGAIGAAAAIPALMVGKRPTR